MTNLHYKIRYVKWDEALGWRRLNGEVANAGCLEEGRMNGWDTGMKAVAASTTAVNAPFSHWIQDKRGWLGR